MNSYLTGQLVVVYNDFIGRVTNQTKQGIWVRPLIENKPDCKKQDHHSCYAEHSVKAYYGD